jgi:hypothetical protein
VNKQKFNTDLKRYYMLEDEINFDEKENISIEKEPEEQMSDTSEEFQEFLKG